jgi:SAM-dependent methyltransferase
MAVDKKLLAGVASYYTARLTQHGQTPRGVDWNGEEGQVLRFEQLTRVIAPGHSAFSLNDLGCGYGALCDFLRKRFVAFSYTGCDISEAMISAGLARHGSQSNLRYLVAAEPPDVADYGVASGIFNVRLDCNEAGWRKYLESTLDILDRTSRRGFAFNCLTSYSDREKMRGDLYYADPCDLFNLCMRRYSRRVALLHDYGLYEFTMIVRKDA